MYLCDSAQSIEKKSKVEIKSDVAVNLSVKRLPSAGSPCERKSWFDHNVIIRSYVHAGSVVHATEIHIWAYTRIGLNLMRSLNGVYPKRLRKKYICA